MSNEIDNKHCTLQIPVHLGRAGGPGFGLSLSLAATTVFLSFLAFQLALIGLTSIITKLFCFEIKKHRLL